MTLLQKHQQNKRLIKAYDAFLPEVKDIDDRLKLITEIGRLNVQNMHVAQMTKEQRKMEQPGITLRINSTINETETEEEIIRNP